MGCAPFVLADISISIISKLRIKPVGKAPGRSCNLSAGSRASTASGQIKRAFCCERLFEQDNSNCVGADRIATAITQPCDKLAEWMCLFLVGRSRSRATLLGTGRAGTL